MNNCLDLFEGSGLSGAELRERVDGTCPNFMCERELCSSYSPGPVTDEENIAFLLINPLHYDNGKVVPVAFQELTNRDLSVIRVSHAQPEDIHSTRDKLVQIGLNKIPPKMRAIDEACVASVNEIRSIQADGARIIGVYDTAIPDNNAHASLFACSNFSKEKKNRMALRNKVWSVFSKSVVKYDQLLP